MNWGKVAVLTLVLAPVLIGGGIWYAQEYAFYEELDPAEVSLSVTAGGQPVPLEASAIRAIDSGSAPHRWRACARLTAPLPDTAEPFSAAAPSHGPRWFDCFDADSIGHDLESGAATGYLGQSEIRPDVDRVFAVYPDGRIFGWHQLNDKTPESGVIN